MKEQLRHPKAVERNLSVEFEKDFTIQDLPKWLKKASSVAKFIVIGLSLGIMLSVFLNADPIFVVIVSLTNVLTIILYNIVDFRSRSIREKSSLDIKKKSLEMIQKIDPAQSDLTTHDLNLLYERTGFVNIVEIRADDKDYVSYRPMNDRLELMNP